MHDGLKKWAFKIAKNLFEHYSNNNAKLTSNKKSFVYKIRITFWIRCTSQFYARHRKKEPPQIIFNNPSSSIKLGCAPDPNFLPLLVLTVLPIGKSFLKAKKINLFYVKDGLTKDKLFLRVYS